MIIGGSIARVLLAARVCALGIAWAGLVHAEQGEGRYLEVDEFLRAAFPADEAKPSTLWVDDALRAQIESLLGHPFDALRVRYWEHAGRTAWIFDEIGKEEPITIGIAVADGAVEMVRVLEFREPRGWEVRHPFFTDQFSGARAKKDRRLDRSIDGITGATLSVAAVTRAVRLALFMSERTERHPS